MAWSADHGAGSGDQRLGVRSLARSPGSSAWLRGPWRGFWRFCGRVRGSRHSAQGSAARSADPGAEPGDFRRGLRITARVLKILRRCPRTTAQGLGICGRVRGSRHSARGSAARSADSGGKPGDFRRDLRTTALALEICGVVRGPRRRVWRSARTTGVPRWKGGNGAAAPPAGAPFESSVKEPCRSAGPLRSPTCCLPQLGPTTA